jgi:hypothetical protein
MKAKISGNLKDLTVLTMLAVTAPLDARADMLWNWSYLNPDAKISAAGTLNHQGSSGGCFFDHRHNRSLERHCNYGSRGSPFMLLASGVEQQRAA